MVLSETRTWPEGGFDFERLLDFGLSAETSRPAKQLACARCHGQKLRCVRRTGDAPVCDRCLAANAECVSRQPQRMGRPADTANNSASARHNGRLSRAGPGPDGALRAESGSTDFKFPPSKKRQRSTGIPSASPSGRDTAVDYGSSAGQFELDRWVWPSPPATNQASAAPQGGAASSLSQLSSGDSSSSSGLTQPSSGLGSYAGSSLGTLGSPSHVLLPSLEDLSSLFPGGGIDTTLFEPPWTPETSDGAPDSHSPLDDPVEHLSRLHLELYHCLVAVKAVEKMKRDRLRSSPSSEPTKDIDTSWSENLFRTTERFIEALQDYIGFGPNALAGSAGLSSSTAAGALDKPPNGREGSDVNDQEPHVDTATGLMIVSCYTRLVQIFDVVVFVVETFRDMDCPGNYVQLRFGAFAPAASRALQARVLGQYVLHLLGGISEAVDRAVASRQPYARAVAEVRRSEDKLKERILATLH
ncbi:hypothetical protein N658DRAFT_225268 [Parathielavia hyrcaniae]|uniref:Zn(2)-C6 fungal-type domain-containing protein n=1 Tax=Parathielavia hyrcaniae TaxID=113614 RepID=A0AAN6PV43_9PEZI|nr:hypothetical protein N658DRAFT_225268 [Parathielavia hyrcaniae]